MKYNLSTIIGTECRNSDIHHIWVLDADNSNYFYWKDSSLPKIHKLKDSQRIAISAAADGLLNGYAGICVFPSTSAVLDSFHALYDINRNRIPLFVICFTDEYDILNESIFHSLLKGANIFVRSVSDKDRVDFRIANSLQYAIAEKQVSVLLIDRKLNSDEKFDKCWRYKVHHTAPVVLPPSYAVRELADLINGVDKVTVLCGEHCQDCIVQLQQLVSLIKSPLAYMPAIRKELQGKTPYEVGIFGKWCEKSTLQAMNEAELILLLDYTEKDFRLFPADPMIIQITPYQLNGVDAQKRKRIYRGDICETLHELLPLLKEKADASFGERLNADYKLAQQQILDIPQTESDLFRKLLATWNDLITPNTIVCSYGYNSYLLNNFLLNIHAQQTVNLSYDLLDHGGILFEAVGLNGGDSKKPVIVFMDMATMYNELCSLIPLTTLEYPIKLCILNRNHTATESEKNPFTYKDAAESMHIPYYSVSDIFVAERVLNEWMADERGAILEVFDISFPDDLLTESETRIIPLFSESFEHTLHLTLQKLDVGNCFYYSRALSASGFHTEFQDSLTGIYSPRSVFYAAVGAANTSEKIPVCIATSLKDVLQMFPGIREARRNNIPVLFLVLLTESQDIFSRDEMLVLHKMIHLISAYYYLADDPEQDLGLILGEAIAEAQHLQGVATVVFDPNMYQADHHFSSEIFDSPYVESVVYPNEEELDRIAKIINYSKNTVIFAGAGCRNAHREVMELARKLKAPLGWSFRVKDEFDHDNFYPIGMAGLLANPGLEEAFKKCEVLILLGTRIGLSSKISKTCKIIQIDINPYNLGIPHPVDIGIVGEIRTTLRKLLPQLVTIGQNQFAERCSRIFEEDHASYEETIHNRALGQDGVLTESVFIKLNQLAPRNAWIIADMVIPWYLTALNIQSLGERRLFSTGENIYTSNSTGFGVGVHAASPDIPLIVVSTNITFFRQIDNLVKLVQTKQNIKIFVLHLWADNQRIDYSEFRISQHQIGMKIESYEQLEEKIQIALSLNDPVLVDIPVLRKELIKSPPLLPTFVQKYSLILRKLYINSEKEEMLQTFGNYNHLPPSDE